MRLSNAQLVPDKITRLMNPRDRAAFGILIPEERRRKVEATAENELQKLCEQELFRHEIEFLHLSPRAREKKGWPDLTFVLSGMPMAVELKTVTGRLSPDQERVLSRMQANGWQTYVVRSFDVFKSLLEVQHARLSLLPS